MAAYLNRFLGGLRQAVRHAWPDVAENGVFLLEQVEDVPFGDLALPFASLAVTLTPEDWGLANRTYRADVEVWRIDLAEQPGYVAVDGWPVLIQNLEALRDVLFPGPADGMTVAGELVGQVMEEPVPDWGAGNRANRFFKQKQWNAAGGVVRVYCVVGEAAE